MKVCSLTGRMVKRMVTILLLTGFSFTGYTQMKIGNNPTSIQPASILELESDNQALRLTQVSDTSNINDVIASESPQNGATPYQAAEGMIVYQKKDSSLYMRVKGHWHKILSLADMESVDLEIRNTIDTLTVNDSLNVANVFTINNDTAQISSVFVMQDSVLMNNLVSVPTDSMLLTIDSNGIVHQMNLDVLLAGNSQIKINGIDGNTFHLKFDTADNGSGVPWIDSITFAPDTTLVLNIPLASVVVNAGLVSDTTQSFAGTKSFLDSLAIGKTTAPNSTIQINGNVSMAAFVTTSNISLDTANYRTIICDMSGKPDNPDAPTITVILPDPIDGRFYTIKKTGDPGENQLGAYIHISGDFADGGTGTNIYNNWTSITVQALGSKWYIVGH